MNLQLILLGLMILNLVLSIVICAIQNKINRLTREALSLTNYRLGLLQAEVDRLKALN
jgi:hypothetical protein